MATPKVYFEISNSTPGVKSQVVVSVYVDASTPINAVDLEINYPKDKLQSLEFDNTNSIVDIWQAKPGYLGNGHISLVGGMIKPYSAGAGGLIIKLPFKVLKAGTAELSFIKSNIYFADGKGTKILADSSYTKLIAKEAGPLVATPFQPFKPTPSNTIIAEEVKKIKEEKEGNSFLLPSLIILGIIVGLSILWVYNKRRRKK